MLTIESTLTQPFQTKTIAKNSKLLRYILGHVESVTAYVERRGFEGEPRTPFHSFHPDNGTNEPWGWLADDILHTQASRLFLSSPTTLTVWFWSGHFLKVHFTREAKALATAGGE